MGTISVPLPPFGTLSGPFNGTLTTDGKSVKGGFSINGITIGGVEGSEATIGGFDPSVTAKDGKASFSCGVNILKQSYTFKNGEKISLKGSIAVDDFIHYTVKLTGTDTKPKAIIFDEKDSEQFSKGKVIMTGSVTLMEDPLFKNAGIFIPEFYEFKGWVQKLTISIQITLEDEHKSKKKTATLTRTIIWALRPLFGPKSDNPPDQPPPPVTPPTPPYDRKKTPIPTMLFLFMVGIPILRLLPSRAMLLTVSGNISSVISNLQKVGFNVTKDAAKAEEVVQELASESAEVTEEIELAEEGIETAEAGIEGAEASIEVAEGILASAEAAEVVAASEVATATAAEIAASVTEAADWWTIIGGIISGAALVAATAAVAVAVSNHNDTVKKQKNAKKDVGRKKSELGKHQLDKKHAETTKTHKKDELKIIQDKLKIAKKNKQDRQDVKDILKAAHIGLEKMQKEIESQINK